MLMLSTAGGAGAAGVLTSSSLAPGQAVEVKSSNGSGHGSARDNYVRLAAFVSARSCFWRVLLQTVSENPTQSGC